MIRLFSAIAALLVVPALMIPQVVAQGLLISNEPGPRFRLPRPIPQPPGQPGLIYDVAKLEIDTVIRDQVAQVQVGQTFKNCTNRTLQVRFVFPLPYDGAVEQMTFMVDGQELEGKLMEADRAREIYQSYVRRSQDPALVQWIGTGMYQTQVFPVPPGAERTVSLRYTQLCKRSGSLNDWILPLSPTRFTAHPIGEIVIRGRIRDDRPIGNVYSPSHDVQIERESKYVVRFKYEAKSTVPSGDFRILWDTGDNPVQVSVVAHRPETNQDGFFMLMLQPQLPDPPASYGRSGKNVVMVLDKSGSMRGEKIDQTRRAAKYVVDRLKARDRFTIIAYDTDVETFRSELTEADKPTREDALEYVESMLAGGSTNIDEALSRAFQIARDADGPAYVVFITDGQPTVGEKNTMKIAANAKNRLHRGARLFSLGVGHDVNSRLLDKLASICLGQTTYVRPGEPIDQVVQALYDRIGAPALVDAKLKLTVDGKEGRIRKLYPADMYDLFSGDQLVVVGRYRKPGQLKIELTGEFLDEPQRYVFEDELPKQTGSGQNVFVERLWATRRIGQIIDDIDLHGEDKELVDELIVLSKRHGILTPYTAYLADERTDLNDMASGRRVASDALQVLREEEVGGFAFRQRAFKGELKSAQRAQNAPQQLSEVEFNMMGGMLADGSRAGVGGRTRLQRGAARQAAIPALADSSGVAVPLDRDEPVKRIAAKTFFLRNNRYVDADATDEQIQKAKKIVQFSDEYFDLLAKVDKESAGYFAEDREVLVVIKGKPYLIVPPKA